MPDDKRRVALAIGVSDAKPLDYLGGAVNGAHTFFQWAVALGYEASLLTDETDPVTLSRLQDKFREILQKQPIQRLIIYFAGHGLIRGAEEGLWLLSDWKKDLRAVAVEVLKRRLGKYFNVEQIAIFADSCRSLPADIDAADLTADGVLGSNQSARETIPPIDKFIAAQDGAATYMIPGATPDKDRCLFSGVLMEGLWGLKPTAFSTLRPGKVTSQSLGAYLRAEVPKLAARYKFNVHPSVVPTFPEGADIYFGEGETPKPPTFPEWPQPEALSAMGINPQIPIIVREAGDLVGGDRVNIGYRVNIGGMGDGGSEDSEGWGTIDRLKIDRLKEEVGRPTSGLAIKIGPSLLDRLRKQPRPRTFETGSGFAAEGAPVRAVWTTDGVFAAVGGQANWWQIGEAPGDTLRKPTPLLVEFEDGLFAATTGLPQFIASILRARRGVSAVIYREIQAPARSAHRTERAIARMENGALRADAKTDLAVELRQAKHADPVLGVISAYLYDSIGDVESIRRMAYFYIRHQQPIPYDIALLAQLRGELRDGLLWAQVPAVPSRKPRTESEREFKWTCSPTKEAEGVVGGLWPWMRQGWTFLDAPSADGTTLILPGLIELKRHLTPGRFATLDARGGRKLAKLFGLAAKGRTKVPRPAPRARRAT